MKNYTSYYFLGIGGIGMSALARYFHAKGFTVGGYDRTSTVLTKELENEGIEIHYEDEVSMIPEEYKNPETCFVVITPAIPAEHKEWAYFREQGFQIMKRAQVLGQITRAGRGLCIAGTHGKTTTSTMTAHLLHSSHVECNAFLGGVSRNFDKNLLLSDKTDLVVIEADEYDRSFHQLSPYMAVITAADADHLDIYGSAEAVRESFEHFTSLIREGGCLIMRKGIAITPKLQEGVTLYTYSAQEGGDFHAENIRIDNGEIYFDFATPKGVFKDFQLGVPVMVNVENAVAALAIAWLNEATEDELRAAIASFRGIRRRFDFHVKGNVSYLDDYAHHPKELEQSIGSIKALFPDKKVCGIFQPHLYTRTRDFAPEFAEALSKLDEVILLDIYPARELPIPGVSSQIIFDPIENTQKTLVSKEQLLAELPKHEFDVLVTVGAGDIDKLIPEITAYCESLNKA